MDDRTGRRDPNGQARRNGERPDRRDDEARTLSITITGASGFIGRHLVRRLLEDGVEVIAVTRRPEALRDHSHSRLRIENIDLEHELPSIARGSALVHLAAMRAGAQQSRARYLEVNRDATLRLAETAIRAETRRFVNLSTAMVFGPTHGVAVDESGPIQRFARKNSYLSSKIEALERTEALVPSGLPLVSLFPAIVYGPDHPSTPNRLTSHIRRLRSSPVRLHPPDVKQFRTLAYVGDVVSGIRAAINRPLESGSRFILGGEDISMHGFEQLVLEILDRKAYAVRIPPVLAHAAATAADILLRKERESGYRTQLSVLGGEWCFDSTRAKTILGYESTPLHIGIQKTIQFIKTTRR